MTRRLAPWIASLLLVACGPPAFEGEWEGEAQDCTLSGQDFPEDAYDVTLSLFRDGDTVEIEYTIDGMFATDLEIDEPEGDFFYSDDGFEVTITGEAPVDGGALDMEVMFELDYDRDDRTEGTGDLDMELRADGETKTVRCDLELARQ